MKNYWKKRWYKKQPLVVRVRVGKTVPFTDIFFPYSQELTWAPDSSVFVNTVEVLRNVRGNMIVEYSLPVASTVCAGVTLMLDLRF